MQQVNPAVSPSNSKHLDFKTGCTCAGGLCMIDPAFLMKLKLAGKPAGNCPKPGLPARKH